MNYEQANRLNKAQLLARTGRLTPTPDGYTVVGDCGTTHTVTPTSCDCTGHAEIGRCSHTLAAYLVDEERANTAMSDEDLFTV